MVGQHGLLMFAVVALLIALTPGPNMVYLLSRVMAHGRRAGIAALMGVAVAFVLHVVAASSGLTALLMSSDHALQGLRVAGAGMLLWLGARSVTGIAAMPAWPIAPLVLRRETTRQLFVSGFLVNALNPVVVLFFITVLPQFVIPAADGSVLGQSLTLGLTYAAISVGVNLAVMLGAARVAGWMRSHPRRLRAVRLAMAAALSGLALRQLWHALL